jgi:type II secretory pathway pseudopilin PulG
VIANLKAGAVMRQSLKLRNYKITKLQNPQRGYMLITLVLALALITIALLTVLPEIGQQIRRDREEEMRHRGTAYMRAIQHYYRRLGRYPSRLEDLENTNNVRFLRKRYKDPLSRDRGTGKEKDFKLLHQQDIILNNGPVLGPTPPGGPQGAQPGGPSPAANAGTEGTVSDDTGKPPDAEGNSPQSPASNPGSGLSGPTFGGGPILGVASTSKATTIRVFFNKNHYNDWLFIYVPGIERGGLLTGPVNPNLPSGNLNAGTPPPPNVQSQPTQPAQPTQPTQTPVPTPPE